MEKQKKEKKPSVLSRVFRIADVSHSLLWLSVTSSVLGFLCGAVPFLSVFFIAREFLTPVNGTANSETITLWIIIAGISILANTLLSFLGSYGCHFVAFKLLYAFKLRVMEHLGKLSMQYFTKKTTGGIQKTIDECAECVESFIGHMLPDLLGSGAVVLVLMGGMFLLSPWLALTVLVAIVVAVKLQMSVFGKKSQKIMMDVFIANQKMTGAFSEYVKGMAEVKLFGITGKMTRGLEENISDYRTWEIKAYKPAAVPMGLYKSIILSMLSFILPVGVLMIQLNPIPNTMLAVLMALIVTPAIYDPFMTCLSYGTQMATLAVGLDTVEDVFTEKPMEFANTGVKLKNSDVSFENVSFSYQAEGENRSFAVKDINFTAEQGKMTALVGESGGGKSTIGQLISRFYDTNEGKITIGGADIKEIPIDVLMDNIAYVLQDTYLFSGSIYDNITMNRNYSKEVVEQAAKAAQCHDFITATQNGYQTKLGSGGIRLSGGETQRLSIARAILKDAPIVILDEALAYSDAENENLIQQAIANLTKDKTVIIIAHRLQSIMRADQIILLKKGEIKERGNHEVLMYTDTEYKELWDLQHEVDNFALSMNEKGAMSV